MTGQNMGDSLSRRAVLGTIGAGGAVSIAGCGFFDSDEEEQADDDVIRVGISVPQEGRWESEGAQLQAGYLLAAQHLNDPSGPMAGDGEYEPPFDVGSGGVLDRTVEITVRNTNSTADGAEQSAEELADEGVDVLLGGASAGEGLRIQEIATAEELVYMGGFTPTNRLGGADCSRFGFNGMHNARMAAEALVSVLPDRLPAERDTFAQVYPSNDFGDELQSTIEEQLSDRTRFRQNVDVSGQVGAGSYAGVLEDVLDTGVSVIVLNFTGLAGAIALEDLAELAEQRGRQDIHVIAPIMTRELFRNAGAALVPTDNEVIGTVSWTPNLDDPFTEQFLDGWARSDVGNDLDVPAIPSELSQLAYTQLYQYGAAVERAGTVESDDVIEELEGVTYDFGPGEGELRACDHQAFAPVPVVEGLPEGQQEPGTYTELVDIVDVGYGCDESPASDCSL